MRYFFGYELPKIEGLFKPAYDRRRPDRCNEEEYFQDKA